MPMYSHLKNKHAEIYSGSNTKQNLINMKISIFSKYRVHTPGCQFVQQIATNTPFKTI